MEEGPLGGDQVMKRDLCPHKKTLGTPSALPPRVGAAGGWQTVGSHQTPSLWHPDPGLPSLQNCENKCLLFRSHQDYDIFVIAILRDEDNRFEESRLLGKTVPRARATAAVSASPLSFLFGNVGIRPCPRGKRGRGRVWISCGQDTCCS